jgi:hypothetical protein
MHGEQKVKFRDRSFSRLLKSVNVLLSSRCLVPPEEKLHVLLPNNYINRRIILTKDQHKKEENENEPKHENIPNKLINFVHVIRHYIATKTNLRYGSFETENPMPYATKNISSKDILTILSTFPALKFALTYCFLILDPQKKKC